jgi:serine protease Do
MCKQIAGFLFVGVCCGFSCQAPQSSFNIPNQSFGTIDDTVTNTAMGTAFVVKTFGGQLRVVTCAHVAMTGTYKYTPLKSAKSYALSHLLAIKSQDISIFKIDENVAIEGKGWEGLELGDGKRLGTGDRIVYIGYKVADNSFQADTSTITATGTGLTFAGGIADFIEFEGIGRPGFSGGPVFNVRGAVVAIITEAWTKKGFQEGAATTAINRAVLTTAAHWLLKESITYRLTVPVPEKK